MFSPLRLLVLLLGLAVPTAAQAAIDISGTYAFGSIGAYYGGTCGGIPQPQPNGRLRSESGVIAFGSSGFVFIYTDVRETCASGGEATSSRTGARTSAYTISSDGEVTIDFDPANPGTDVRQLWMRPDRMVMVGGGDNPAFGHHLTVAIRQEVSPLGGVLPFAAQYHVGSMRIGVSAAGISATSRLGIMTVQSGGVLSESGVRHVLDTAGNATNQNYTATQAAAIGPNGQLSGTLGNGAITPDGSIMFGIVPNGPEVELVVAIRRGSNLSTPIAGGDWAGGFLEIQSGLTTDVRTANANRHIIDTTAGYTGTSTRLTSGPFQPPTTSNDTEGGFVAVASNGTLSLLANTGPPSMPGALDARGVVSMYSGNAPAKAQFHVLIRKGVLPSNYPLSNGGTPGTGGIAPTLTSFGGFAYLGNPVFGIRLANALGGSVGIIGLASAPAPVQGLVALGGTLWIQPVPPLLLELVPLPLTGTPGAAGAGSINIFLPLPSTPSLDRQTVYLQGFAEDSGAPFGYSMTPGLQVTLYR